MNGKFEFYIPSSDGISRLHGIQWAPTGEVRALLQISHGMVDHIARYDDFARAMNVRGIAVIGHDHLGHGKTGSREKHGIFAEENGAFYVLEDIRIAAGYGKRQYPGVPHYILGHSMGSFFVRRYLTLHADTVDGAVIMGTGSQSLLLLQAGSMAVRLAVEKDGRRDHNKQLHRLVLGSYNKSFEPGKTSHDWLSRDAEQAVKYEADPDCQFTFSNGAYEDFFQIMLDLKKEKQFERIPKGLPILLISGDCDPVGEQGKGVKRVYKSLKRMALTDVTMKLYKGARHELLNETNKKEVFADIGNWVEKHASGLR